MDRLNREEIVSSLVEKFGRKACVQDFTDLMLLSGGGRNSVSSVFLYGASGMGKTMLVRECLSRLNIDFAYVNCLESYNEKLVYEAVLESLGIHPTEVQVDSIASLIQTITTALGRTDSPLFLILDKAEFLRNLDAHFMATMLNLNGVFPDSNISSILITEIPWSKFGENISVREPFLFYLPSYGKEDVIRLIASKSSREDYSPQCHVAFLTNLWRIFNPICQNLTEFTQVCCRLFPYYVSPIFSGELAQHETQKLWRAIDPHLKQMLEHKREQHLSTSYDSHSKPVPLSRYSKLLLIAGYLASHNHAKFDARLYTSRANKKSRLSHKAKREKNEQSGYFELDRLIGIFYRILGHHVQFTCNLHSLLSTLVSLGLMHQVSSINCLYNPRYRSVLSYDSLLLLCKSARFDLTNYVIT